MFRLPEEVKKSMENYKRSLEEVQEGKMSSARFRGVRVPWGIYSHRGGEVYMARIRVPAGVVSPVQLETLDHVSREFGDGILHITTRQDVQIHKVNIEDTLKESFRVYAEKFIQDFEENNKDRFFEAFKNYFKDRAEFNILLDKLDEEGKHKLIRLGFFY